MLKKITIILFFTYSINLFGCTCNEPPFQYKFITSDFVADVEITKIYLNKKGENWYKADIKVNELFKGENIKSIYIHGKSDGTVGSSCYLFIPKGKRLIVYSSINENGNHGITSCSGSTFADKKNNDKYNLELKVLRVLKAKKIDYTNEPASILFPSNSIDDFLGIKMKSKFAIYDVAITPDYQIKKIKIIKGFKGFNDRKITRKLSKIKLSKPSYIDEYVPNFIVVLFYDDSFPKHSLSIYN